MGTMPEVVLTSAGFTDERGDFFMPDEECRWLWHRLDEDQLQFALEMGQETGQGDIRPSWGGQMILRFTWPDSEPYAYAWAPERPLTRSERRRLLAEHAAMQSGTPVTEGGCNSNTLLA
jgi:hypothetical protein